MKEHRVSPLGARRHAPVESSLPLPPGLLLTPFVAFFPFFFFFCFFLFGCRVHWHSSSPSLSKLFQPQPLFHSPQDPMRSGACSQLWHDTWDDHGRLVIGAAKVASGRDETGAGGSPFNVRRTWAQSRAQPILFQSRLCDCPVPASSQRLTPCNGETRRGIVSAKGGEGEGCVLVRIEGVGRTKKKGWAAVSESMEVTGSACFPREAHPVHTPPCQDLV